MHAIFPRVGQGNIAYRKKTSLTLLLDDPRGNVFDDLFEEAVVVSLDDGGSFDVVFCTFDILALVALVDIS